MRLNEKGNQTQHKILVRNVIVTSRLTEPTPKPELGDQQICAIINHNLVTNSRETMRERRVVVVVA